MLGSVSLPCRNAFDSLSWAAAHEGVGFEKGVGKGLELKAALNTGDPQRPKIPFSSEKQDRPGFESLWQFLPDKF